MPSILIPTKTSLIKLLTASIFILLVISSIGTFAENDRGQKTFSPDPVKIDSSRKEEFRVLFPYANPFDDKELNNVISEITLSGNGFEIIKDKNYDLFDPEGVQKANCTDPNSVPKHPILLDTITPSSIIYGLQTSIKTDTPGGERRGILKESATGCILISLKVLESAIVGQKAQLKFNWYLENENEAKNQPIIGIYNFEVVAGEGSNANVCGANQELSEGICRAVCALGFVRNNLGTCVEQSTLNSVTSKTESEVIPAEDFKIVIWLLSIAIALFALSIILVIIAIFNYKKYI